MSNKWMNEQRSIQWVSDFYIIALQGFSVNTLSTTDKVLFLFYSVLFCFVLSSCFLTGHRIPQIVRIDTCWHQFSCPCSPLSKGSFIVFCNAAAVPMYQLRIYRTSIQFISLQYCNAVVKAEMEIQPLQLTAMQ